jgi:hypothetical protein
MNRGLVVFLHISDRRMIVSSVESVVCGKLCWRIYWTLNDSSRVNDACRLEFCLTSLIEQNGYISRVSVIEMTSKTTITWSNLIWCKPLQNLLWVFRKIKQQNNSINQDSLWPENPPFFDWFSALKMKPEWRYFTFSAFIFAATVTGRRGQVRWRRRTRLIRILHAFSIVRPFNHMHSEPGMDCLVNHISAWFFSKLMFLLFKKICKAGFISLNPSLV